MANEKSFIDVVGMFFYPPPIELSPDEKEEWRRRQVLAMSKHYAQRPDPHGWAEYWQSKAMYGLEDGTEN